MCCIFEQGSYLSKLLKTSRKIDHLDHFKDITSIGSWFGEDFWPKQITHSSWLEIQMLKTKANSWSKLFKIWKS